MSCCGQKRHALVSGVAPARASLKGGGAAYQGSFLVGAAPRGREGQSSPNVALRYLGLGLFSSRGARSGRLYSCDGTGATLDVDPSDVEGLVRTRLFVRA
jgi:hypothetical protein